MQILKDLWKDKPVLIVVVLAVAVGLYLLYKSNQNAVVAPPPSAIPPIPHGKNHHSKQHPPVGSPPIPTPPFYGMN